MNQCLRCGVVLTTTSSPCLNCQFMASRGVTHSPAGDQPAMPQDMARAMQEINEGCPCCEDPNQDTADRVCRQCGYQRGWGHVNLDPAAGGQEIPCPRPGRHPMSPIGDTHGDTARRNRERGFRLPNIGDHIYATEDGRFRNYHDSYLDEVYGVVIDIDTTHRMVQLRLAAGGPATVPLSAFVEGSLNANAPPPDNSFRVSSQIHDPDCTNRTHHLRYCVCSRVDIHKNVHGEELSEDVREMVSLFLKPSRGIYEARSLAEIVKDIFYMVQSMRSKVTDGVKQALHLAERGDTPDVKRTLRNVLDELGTVP